MNQKGFTHQAIALIIAVVLVVGAAGFLVYKKNNTNALYISIAGCNSTPTLYQGSYGNCVKAVQTLLNGTRCWGSIAVDGSFGPITRQRVIWYQQRARLAADGIVGPNTWNALLSYRVSCGYGK